jgi:hypothetical protein
MRLRTIVCFSLVLSCLAANAAVPPSKNSRCPPPPNGGSLSCGARCMTFHLGSYCDSTVEPKPSALAYCYQVRYEEQETSTQTCHEGSYDPCCDPDAVF